MQYLEAAIDLASQRGYLEFRDVKRSARKLPRWFRKLETPEGIDQLSRRLGTVVPSALQELYAASELVAFLQLSGANMVYEDFVESHCGLSRRSISIDHYPVQLFWCDHSFICFRENETCGEVLGASIYGDDPRLAWGEPYPAPEDPEEINYSLEQQTVSEWVFDRVDKYEERLQNWVYTVTRGRIDGETKADYKWAVADAKCRLGVRERLRQKRSG